MGPGRPSWRAVTSGAMSTIQSALQLDQISAGTVVDAESDVYMPSLTYGIALLLTVAVELPIVTLTLVRGYRLSLARAAVLDVAANLLTHPIVWFVLVPTLRPLVGDVNATLTAEAVAWLVEGAAFWLVVRRDALGLLLLSLLANLTSYLVGVALQTSGLLH